jgi:5,10-methylenetetrahydromethanopterin reductase
MAALAISCALAPATGTHEHIALAEELGYHRAWCFDSPALYADVWMVLARAAASTRRIGLAPGVLVPSLRHPMVVAASIAGLHEWAPGRVALAVGAGLTGRLTLGQPPMRWSEVHAYVVAVRALLDGREHEWEGSKIKMLQGPGFVAPRPIDVPVIVAADGPKGMAVAAEVGDGLISPSPARAGAWTSGSRVVLTWGTVLGDGETPDSPRAIAATTPGLAVNYHVAYGSGPAALDALAGGPAFGAAVDQVAPDERHLALHEGHLVAANRFDRFPREAYESFVPKVSLTGDAASVRAKLDRFAARGITEVAYQPSSADIEHDLRTFAAVAFGR